MIDERHESNCPKKDRMNEKSKEKPKSKIRRKTKIQTILRKSKRNQNPEKPKTR